MSRNVIRLTESELKQMVKEQVKKYMTERIKWEKGMSDDEVRKRRNDRHRADQEWDEYQSLHPYHDFGPSYADVHEFEWMANPEEMERDIESRRYWQHRSTQNHPNMVDTDED